MKISKSLVFIMLLFAVFSYSQNKLTGKVMNHSNRPVPNAKVFVDSIYTNVNTNKNGEFEVLLPEKVAVINIYSDKYGLLSSKFSNENSMSFIFLESEKEIKNRIKKGGKITIGYSEEDQGYRVKTAQTMDVQNDKSTRSFVTIYDLLRGRLAGVTVSRDNKITIRGLTSIRNVSEPLFVVDGVIVSSIDYLFPNNVKNVSVLKDAAASIYGAQGSSGVIVITTK
ncbi:TonB-dependent outer membrane receptor, SusC/RagA subfamily, signature region [Flavobacterium omnivorum]|uniref:TonB-dependent outer membrane receptor, SusC/RagA subfamily, signature region n=2 Tax=Flavobacterium omnivorum TaxID=178355 RepID=A0A1G7XEN8_9FLAO|nr:TonB-dependent outer membrane receptor, SusC/RagA subfamily, signature region [Flavobacterium omnivorum]